MYQNTDKFFISYPNHQQQQHQNMQQYDQQQPQNEFITNDKHPKLTFQQQLQLSIQALKNQTKQLKQCVQIQIDKQIFADHFTKKIFNHNLSYHSQQKLTIKNNLPFFININSFINNSPLSKIYHCQYKNVMIKENVLADFLQIKDILHQKEIPKDTQRSYKYTVTNKMFNELYYKTINQLQQKHNLTNKATYSSSISPLKCKIIDLSQYQQEQINYIREYLQKLRFYYQYKDKVHSQHIFLQSRQKQQKQTLKLFYFNIMHQKQYPPNVIKIIVDYFQKNIFTTSIPNNQQKQSINGQTVTLLILDYLLDQNWQIRKKTLSIIQKTIMKNHSIITINFLQKLWGLTTHIQNVVRKNANKLLQICILKLKEIQNQQKNTKSNQQKLVQPQYLLDLMFITCLALNGFERPKQKNISLNNGQKSQNKIKDQYKVSKQIKIEFINTYLQAKKDQLKSILSQNNKDKTITMNQLSDILSKNYVTKVNFSFSLNSDLNLNFQSYQNYVNNQKINHTTYKDEFMYIINEYHHGKTLKQLILNNWKGFQDYNVVHKLMTKLFWIHAQLQFYGLHQHIPTLQNIIINQNLKNPDININMISFLNSIFLFQLQKSNKNDGLFSDKNLSQKNKKSSLEQLLPFVYSNKNKIQIDPYSILTGIGKVNRVKNFLTVLMFILCRRLDHFQGSQSISKNLKEILQNYIKQNVIQYKQLLQKRLRKQQQQKAKKQQQKAERQQQKAEKQYQKTNSIQKIPIEKNIQEENKQKVQRQKFNRLKALYDKSSKYSLFNTLQILNSNQIFNEIDKGHFINLTFFVPRLFSMFLKKYDLPNKDIKQYEMISYKNSNTYRINEFENYLGLNKNYLLNIFQNSLVCLDGDENKKQIVTWRDIFCLLFTKGQETIVRQSKLLTYLCQFFNYSNNEENNKNQLSPEMYFALKFDIDFYYFQEKYDGKWFNCFEIFSESQKIEYDMETMCLLKNIKSQVIKITNIEIEKIIQVIQDNQKFLYNGQLKSVPRQDQNKKISLKVKAGIDLLKYLNTYEKRIYIQKIRKSEQKIGSQNQSDENKSDENKLQFFTNEYFQTFNEKDIQELEEILNLFMQKMKIN